MSTMYADADPRSKLATATAAATPTTTDGFGASSYALFGESPPQIDDETGRTWLTRGANFIVAYTLAKPGAVLERRGQVDEYVLLIESPEPWALIKAGGETVEVTGEHIAFIPPGDSRIELPEGGEVAVLSATSTSTNQNAWIEETKAAFAEAGLSPRTWMSPARQQSFSTLELLAGAGFEVCLDWESDEVPLPMATPARSAVP